jgi:hypothetical protein
MVPDRTAGRGGKQVWTNQICRAASGLAAAAGAGGGADELHVERAPGLVSAFTRALPRA